MKKQAILILFCIFFIQYCELKSIQNIINGDSNIKVGVSKRDATLPVGVPLAGYNYGDRRVKGWPIPKFTKYTAFMNPSTGIQMPMWVKCLIIESNNVQYAQVSMDAIGADGGLIQLGYDIAKQQGFNIPLENIILSASHTHSGPGALSFELLWSLAPATDLGKENLRTEYASSIAGCLIEAQTSMKPAKVGIGKAVLKDATHNRRAHISPYVNSTSVDTQLGLIRVDDMNDNPIATLWNFAIHGTCYDADQMNQTGDIMGLANILIEKQVGGVSLFVNSDAGDIAPSHCNPKPDFPGSHLIADAVAKGRDTVETFTDMELQIASQVVDFGRTDLNLTLERLSNCTHGGPIDICTFCSAEFLNCHWDLHLDHKWVETTPRFSAVRMKLGSKNTLLVTSPGESIYALGNQVKSDAKGLGFDDCFVFGYSNNHMGYFTTEEEYEVGGYESQLTFWGIGTSAKIRSSSKEVMERVKPQQKQ